jgi:hypothetical protein
MNKTREEPRKNKNRERRTSNREGEKRLKKTGKNK